MAKNGASFWARGPGLILLTLLVLVGGASVGAAGFIHYLTHPPVDRNTLDPADLMLRTEEVAFQATDGVPLSGWFVSGRPGGPVILLCHDLGSARSSLLNSAAALSRAGYPLFLFDFRGHGRSAARGSSLGVQERLDVLGAVEYLKGRKDIDTGRFGIWGIGMGAYAAVLAAAENREIVALALDSVYPDVPSQLDRLVRDRIPPALRGLVPAIRLFYEPYFSFKLKRYEVSSRVGDLAGRNVLFIAGADTPERFTEAQAVYASLPDSPGGDKNFLELKASVITGLYSQDKKTYDQAIVGFFTTYLPKGPAAGGGQRKAIQVLER
jgi:pimeloyl-ACP methyl ester carboxylesterase